MRTDKVFWLSQKKHFETANAQYSRFIQSLPAGLLRNNIAQAFEASRNVNEREFERHIRLAEDVPATLQCHVDDAHGWYYIFLGEHKLVYATSHATALNEILQRAMKVAKEMGFTRWRLFDEDEPQPL